MPELVLVRHASTAWSGRRYCGRSDPPLDREGVAAARGLGLELMTTLTDPLRIVSSPRRRARQTAEAIAGRARSARIEVDDRWAEVDFGLADGLTFEELRRLVPNLAADLAAGRIEIDWPGGERFAAFVARVHAAWLDAAAADRTTVVVTHGGPLRLAIGLATGVPPGSVVAPQPAGIWRGETTSPLPRVSLVTDA